MYRTLRKPETAGSTVLTDRDKLWLRAVNRSRFLTTDQAQVLAGSPNRNDVNERLALLGHTCGEITTHYSAAELETLLNWAEAIVHAKPSTALRTGFGANVVELRQKRGNLPH